MLCIEIKNKKAFMEKLLLTDAFSDFLLVSAKIDTYVRFDIDGHIRREFYAKEELEGQELHEYVEWEAMRPQVMQMVKGKRTPLFTQILLAYAPWKAGECLSGEGLTEPTLRQIFDGDLRLLNDVKYKNGALTLTSTFSYKVFTMDVDRTMEKCWDRKLCALMEKMGLEYEILC